MKNLFYFLFLFVVLFSCNKDDNNSNDPFKGEDLTSTKTIAKTGNYWDGGVRGFDATFKATVVSNTDGTAEIELKLDKFAENLGEIVYKGEKLSTSEPLILKAKVSTNTIATFDYGSTSTDDPFVLVKFDGNIGDKYTHVSDGKTSVREITDKDFEVDAFGWIVKAFVIDETVPENSLILTKEIGGQTMNFKVSKIRYLVNHRFGPINIQIYVDGGSFPFIVIDCLHTNCDTK